MGAAMKTIGVIGAGQLGLMLAEEAHKLGGAGGDARSCGRCSGTQRLADEHIVAAYDDAAALEELCRRSDVVTYEFENVPGEVLIPLVRAIQYSAGLSSPSTTRRTACARSATPVDARAAHARVSRPCRRPPVAAKRPSATAGGFPLRASRPARWATTATGRSCCVRRRILREGRSPASAVPGIVGGVRSLRFRGERHRGRRRPRDGLLSRGAQRSPRRDSGSVGRAGGDSGRAARQDREREPAFHAASAVIGASLRSSISSRATRSISTKWRRARTTAGHWTIEGCTTNQFRELARYLLGMPLEEPRLVAPTVMKNILGRDLAAAEAIAREGRADVHVHLYGKTREPPPAQNGAYHLRGPERRAVTPPSGPRDSNDRRSRRAAAAE